MCVCRCLFMYLYTFFIFMQVDIYRLLYEYGEILTRVSIAMTRACECHANANECQYFSNFVQ